MRATYSTIRHLLHLATELDRACALFLSTHISLSLIHIYVYTAEVENAIFDYPGIIDAVVIGIPDQLWGLKVHAILEIEGPESEFSPDDLNEFLHTKLSGYKCPKTYEIVQDMPRNEMGKVRRRELIEQHLSGLSEHEHNAPA